jgi:hypothetical protein
MSVSEGRPTRTCRSHHQGIHLHRRHVPTCDKPGGWRYTTRSAARPPTAADYALGARVTGPRSFDVLPCSEAPQRGQ